MTTLADYTETYILEHDLSDTTAESYRYCVSGFERWHGGPIGIENDLTTDMANQWLNWLKQEGRSTYTVKGRRGMLLVLWRAARRDSRIDFDRDPEHVRRIRTDELDNEAFSLEQAEQLLKYCRTLKGCVGSLKIPRAIYYSSFVQAAWDSGLRRGDLWDFDTAIVEAIAANNGQVRVRQNKSRRVVDCYFHQSTIDAMQECLDSVPRTTEMLAPYSQRLLSKGIPDRRHTLPADRVWPLWTHHPRSWAKEFAKVVDGAGLHGRTKFLRRGAATEAEFLAPGSAARKLGHSPHSSGLAEKHYISRKVLPMAPVIGRELAGSA